MKCFTCFNSTKIPKKCSFCNEQFCSNDCVETHKELSHKSLIQKNIKKSNQNSTRKTRKSIFLTKGIFNNKEITYDPMYSIENFTFFNSEGGPKSIGSGSFGEIYLAKHNIDKKKYAIKIMKKEKLMESLGCFGPIYSEINIQSRINHPNIIKLLYVKETNDEFQLVMEYAENGSLFDYAVKNYGLSEDMAFKYFIQISNAIKFLHDNNIMHRDIKPENILVFENDIVKLGDFGWSIKSDHRQEGGSFSGTMEYMAPELVENREYGLEIDDWMLGILLYELIHRISPFRPRKQNFEEQEVVDNIEKHQIIFYYPISDECKELILSLLDTDINKRCSVYDIFTSKLVRKYEKKYEEEKNGRIREENSYAIKHNNLRKNSKSSMESNNNTSTKNSIKGSKIKMKIGLGSCINGQNYQFNNFKIVDNLSSSKLNCSILNNKDKSEVSSEKEEIMDLKAITGPKNNNRNRNKINKLHHVENNNNENILSPSMANTSPKNNIQRTNSNMYLNRTNNDNKIKYNTKIVSNNNLTKNKLIEEKKNDLNDLQCYKKNKIKKKSILPVISSKTFSKRTNSGNYMLEAKNIDVENQLLFKDLTLSSNNEQFKSLSSCQILGGVYATKSVSPDRRLIVRNGEINFFLKHDFPKSNKRPNKNTNNKIPIDGSPYISENNMRKQMILNKVNIMSVNYDSISEKEPIDNVRKKESKKTGNNSPKDNKFRESANVSNNIIPNDNKTNSSLTQLNQEEKKNAIKNQKLKGTFWEVKNQKKINLNISKKK